MPNVFDQFDAATGTGNVFDRFDEPKSQPRNGRPPATPGSGRRAVPSSFLEGIPIAGPYIKGGVERAAAGLAHLTHGVPYEETLQRIQQGDEADLEAHPYIRTAGNVAGATAATLPMIAAAPAAFGMGEGPLAARAAVSGLTGSGIGTVDAGVRSGGDIEAMKTGGMTGFAAGLAGPVAGKLAGAGYQTIKNWLARRGTDLGKSGIEHLIADLSADGLDAPAIHQKLTALGEAGMLADLGPNLRSTAGGLVTMPGEARGIVTKAIVERDAGANARIRGALDTELGPAPIPSRLDAGIRANQKALSPEYEGVLTNARRVDTTPIANDLESAMVNLRGPAQAAASDVRRMLNVTGTDQLDPNPRTLLQTRHAIDGLLEGEENPKVIALLTDTRRAIDSHLAQSVPGIKAVDAKFAELARQRDALTRGQELLRNGPNAVRPAELADELLDGTQPQGMSVGPSAVPLRLRQGARADIDRIVGTNANDRVALQRLIAGEGDWNPAKLSQLFGEDRATKILRVLENERTFAGVSDFVTKNSATAAKQEAVARLQGDTGNSFGVRQAYEAGGLPGIARATGTKGLSKVAEALFQSETSKAALAKLLVSTEHNKVAQALMRVAAPFAPPPEAIGQVARALMLSAPSPSRR